MSRIKFGVALALVAAWVGGFACSSGGTTSCFTSAVGSDCLSCLQARCGSELSSVESACSDYLSCVCPGGNFSCSAEESSACLQMSEGSSCKTASASLGTCSDQSCKTECSGGGATCDGGAGTSTACTGSASFDAGCTNGQLLESCSTTTAGTTSCYYKVGSQQFDCSSCTDTTSCVAAANAACK